MNVSTGLMTLLLIVPMPARLMSADDSGRTQPQSVDSQLTADCLLILRSGLASDEFWPAMHAAEALTYADAGSEVIAALKDRLPKEKDDQRRCGLVRELYRAGDQRHLQILFDVLGNPSSKGRTHAAESLYKIGQTADNSLLREAMHQSESIPLQIMAAAALIKAKDSAALDLVRRQLHSSDPTARNLSAWVIGRHGNKDDGMVVKALLQKETSAATKDEMSVTFLAVSLASLGDSEGRAALICQLSSPNPTSRAMAAEFAGLSRTTGAFDKLKELLKDPVLDVRIRSAQSIIALSNVPSP
ncbi:MAG: HEAT repeat domain-containing protein [Planctomycetaceae bacterium]